ncbi:hypothetical protein, partial [Rhodovulum sulfidophilum]|uniref:hypothetical protein n=1 Tax=Rhodovulum sulfidophilum TaxID=35806 RepID=UPI001F3753B3
MDDAGQQPDLDHPRHPARRGCVGRRQRVCSRRGSGCQILAQPLPGRPLHGQPILEFLVGNVEPFQQVGIGIDPGRQRSAALADRPQIDPEPVEIETQRVALGGQDPGIDALERALELD